MKERDLERRHLPEKRIWLYQREASFWLKDTEFLVIWFWQNNQQFLQVKRVGSFIISKLHTDTSKFLSSCTKTKVEYAVW